MRVLSNFFSVLNNERLFSAALFLSLLIDFFFKESCKVIPWQSADNSFYANVANVAGRYRSQIDVMLHGARADTSI